MMLTRRRLTKRALAKVDRAGFAELARRFRGHGYEKYFDVEHWIDVNAHRAALLGLNDGKQRRVLDLGSGFGYFLFVCRELGHEVQGIDLPEPLYKATAELLGVPVVAHRIEPGAAVPPGLQPFDVVTAHMVCFNGHGRPSLWGAPEWELFLDTFAGAQLYLELNREPDGTLFPRGVAELFGDRGAVITEHRVVFSRVRARADR